jgi:ribosomal protein S12 methylthiotransferase
VQVGGATVPFRPEAERVRLTPPHTAYLRVAEGCSHACTFCAIPGFRGTFRSKPYAALLEEARALVASGAVELNLIAEDTNQVWDFCVWCFVVLYIHTRTCAPNTNATQHDAHTSSFFSQNTSTQHITSTHHHHQQQYGMDRRDGHSLASLLRELGALEGLRWIRILYAYPSYFTDELIDEIANNPKVLLLVVGPCACCVSVYFWCV